MTLRPKNMHHFLLKTLALASFTLAALVNASEPNAGNCFQPGQLWLDTNGIHINAHGGGILFHDGVYYWFGEHKIAGEAGNAAQVGVHAYSSKDLYHWKDEGIALKVSEDPASPIRKGCVIERPKVLYNANTRKFVMWFHLEENTGYRTAASGVAVADSPAGLYAYRGCFRPNAGVWPDNLTDAEKHNEDKLKGLHRDFAGGQMARDMTLFLDDDGKAYQIYSSRG